MAQGFRGIQEVAGDGSFGCGILAGEVGGDGGHPGVHEVIDQVQGLRFSGVNGGCFMEAVISDLDDAGEVKVADSGGTLKPEALPFHFCGGFGHRLTIQDEGKGFQRLRFVFQVAGAYETDLIERKNGAVGAALGGHGGAAIINACRGPLRGLPEHEGEVTTGHGDGRQVRTDIGLERLLGK